MRQLIKMQLELAPLLSHIQPNPDITRYIVSIQLKVDVPWLAGKGATWDVCTFTYNLLFIATAEYRYNDINNHMNISHQSKVKADYAEDGPVSV